MNYLMTKSMVKQSLRISVLSVPVNVQLFKCLLLFFSAIIHLQNYI